MKKLLFTTLTILTLLVSCTKHTYPKPAEPEPPKGYRLVLRCIEFEKDTLWLRNGYILRDLCKQHVVDTIPY